MDKKSVQAKLDKLLGKQEAFSLRLFEETEKTPSQFVFEMYSRPITLSFLTRIADAFAASDVKIQDIPNSWGDGQRVRVFTTNPIA